MYNPPIRGSSYIFYVSLVSQSDTKTFQSNPTLATGDVKSTKDGASLGNLATLPTVTPSSGKSVKVSLSATEMDTDNLLIVFSDAAGSEWCDLSVNIQPVGWAIASITNADQTATTTAFTTDLAESTDDHYNAMFVVFTDGALQGQSRKISDYDGIQSTVTVATAFTEAPATGDPFLIIGRSE